MAYPSDKYSMLGIRFRIYEDDRRGLLLGKRCRQRDAADQDADGASADRAIADTLPRRQKRTS